MADHTFQGQVTRINPALTTSGNYIVVTGVIQMELSQDSASSSINAKLLKGLTGTVTLVQASAENVLLVPLAALHDLGDGTYSVFVVGSDGKVKMKVVEVGLKDSTSAEIKSGLSAGDTVTQVQRRQNNNEALITGNIVSSNQRYDRVYLARVHRMGRMLPWGNLGPEKQ